jgi:cell shape-determining protein MreD
MHVYKKMMSEMIFIQFILMMLAFFVVKYCAYVATEEIGMPRWLNFKPFNCNKCLSTWTLAGVYTVLGLSFDWYYLMIGGIILAILNGIAMEIDQRNKTIKI